MKFSYETHKKKVLYYGGNQEITAKTTFKEDVNIFRDKKQNPQLKI